MKLDIFSNKYFLTQESEGAHLFNMLHVYVQVHMHVVFRFLLSKFSPSFTLNSLP